jgi:hypothetical protein
MDMHHANEMVGMALAVFRATPSERPYEISIRYEPMPDVIASDPQEMCEHPFEAPHLYRIGLAVKGEVVFDGFFADLPHAIDTISRGISMGIADETWPSWMATLEPTWAPS